MTVRFSKAEPTGLCFGVKRAIAQMEKALSSDGELYCVGSPIHNPQEIARLAQKGLRVVASPQDVPSGSTVFIRAHGIAPDLRNALKQRNVRIIDGTCPFVRVAQARAKALEDEGYSVVVAGDASHPEVISIVGGLQNGAKVVSNSTDLQDLAKIERIGLVSQTTLPEDLFASIVSAAVRISPDVKAHNTICRATFERQRAVAELVKRTDGIVVIGGRDSANTAKLFHIAKSCGADVLWIEEAGELDGKWFTGKTHVGIAAGASTPDWLIEEFIQAARQAVDVKGDVRSE